MDFIGGEVLSLELNHCRQPAKFHAMSAATRSAAATPTPTTERE